ncbi:MAG: class I SAM-dependent methyltransferase [Geminicoccaceae bacterium]
MELAEYATMAGVEQDHWWYRGLRAMLAAAWAAHVPPSRPPDLPRLLDVGCGTGANLQAFAQAAQAVGVDMAPAAIDWCRQRGLAATLVGSAAALPFATASFDVVLSCDVLCHRSLPDRARPLREIARVLRPGGILILNLPAFRWLLSPHDHAVQQDHRFTRGEVVQLLGAAGLAPLRVTYWNGLLFPAAVGMRALRRLKGERGSDLAAAKEVGAAPLLERVLGLERRLLERVDLPFGLSVLAVARRAPDAPAMDPALDMAS